MTLPSRRRRRKARLADQVIRDVKAKERAFLREVSRMIGEAIGFPVRVLRVRPIEPTTIGMRRARRLSKAQVAAAFAPLPAIRIDKSGLTGL